MEPIVLQRTLDKPFLQKWVLQKNPYLTHDNIYAQFREYIKMAATNMKTPRQCFLLDILYYIVTCPLYRLTSPRCNKLRVRDQPLSYDYCEHGGVWGVGFRVQGMSHSPFSCHKSPPEARPPLTDRCK